MNEQQEQELKEALVQFHSLLTKIVGTSETTAVPTQTVNTVEQPSPVKKSKVIAPQLVKDFLLWFIEAPEDELYAVKRGQWECRTGYRNSDGSKQAHMLLFHSKLSSSNASNVICVRPVGSELTFFNASRITYRNSWAAQKEPQQYAEDAGAIPIPFENVVSKEAAGLDLSQLELVEWGGSEKLIIPPINRARQWSSTFYVIDRHFAGATALQVGNDYFLFDTDREEVKYNGFNPFFTQLPRKVVDIEDAYSALMPQEVHDAIAAGLDVIRQGEFFFVEADQAAVKALACTNNGLTDAFFYDQLRERLLLKGAAVINWWNADFRGNVEHFIKKCEELNDGKLVESDGIQAAAVFQDLCSVLTTEQGPKLAHVTSAMIEEKKANKPYYGTPGSSHEKTHLCHVDSELELRLAARDDDDERNGPDAGFGIRYTMRIGADSASGQRNHIATGVLQVSDDEVYAIGAVLHQGREHRTVYLPGWYRVYPNTATANWTVSGDVD